MAWTVPQHSRAAVDRAGKIFIDAAASPGDRSDARTVINNWRSSHSFALNTMQMSLRRKARSVDPGAVIAQRIKRLPSIRLKLEIQPNMKLSQMHDLGGARAVLQDVDQVRQVEKLFLTSEHKHELARQDDYINEPKSSGYRGIHLVYKYRSDKSTTYNGLRIEVQLRTRLMHAWATAVETVGTFTKQSLKSSIGNDDFLRFFVVMSAVFAHDEGQPFPPDVPGDIEKVYAEVRSLANKLRVVDRMEAYRIGLRETEANANSGKYSLLQLDIPSSVLTISTFDDLAAATAAFDAAEVSTSADDESDLLQDAVLVSVDSMYGLRSAYPNYFLDTSVFIARVREIVDGA